MTDIRHSLVPAVLLTVLTLTAAQAQSRSAALDPRAASAITTMTGISAEYCERGSKPACEFVDKLQTATKRLVAAQAACASGMRAGCEAVEMGVAEVSIAFRQFGQGTDLARTLPPAPERQRAPGEGPDIFGQ